MVLPLAKFRSVSIRVKIMSKFKVREDQHHKKRVRSGTVIKVRIRVRMSVHFKAKFCTTLRVRMRQRSVL